MRPRDFALMVLICLIWASNNVMSKLIVGTLHVPPLFFTAVRFAIVALVTLPWLLPMPRPRWRILLIGLFMGGGSFGLMFVALKWVSPSEAAIVVQASVPITALLSIVMLGERIRWRRGLGITLTLIGVVLVMYQPGFRVSAGMGYLVASAVLASFGAVMMKQMDAIAPLQFQAWVGLVGLCAVAPASLLTEPGALGSAVAVGWPIVACALYAALVTSVFAHTAYYLLIGRYEANLVAPLTLMTPLMTIALGVSITGDVIDSKMMIGSAIALTGVLIIARRSRSAPLVQAQEHT
ncbi:putative membrane protein [Novosphingobium kunmingense]|uniref:Putative membrane protein n=1 Tax=Novosphingobium kunmingense TaxID=1211806 RepID=A0A2N0I3K1_9SPHN|nr:DMT family transporter [Novosphingobium kunmingense]PKB25754.1 putative membrane protein [Novosphingobium kunmingense]